jgi:hypothetical protein
MMKKPTDSESPSSMGDDSGGREEWTQNDPNDVELGVVASDNSVQIKTLRDDKDDAECTHVLIPRPSHIIVDRDVNGSEDCCSDYKKKMKTSSQDIKHEEKEHPEDGTLVSELRAVPIFCAVCLVKLKYPTEYAGRPIANAVTCFTRIAFCDGWRPWDGHTPGRNSSPRPQVRRNCLTST